MKKSYLAWAIAIFWTLIILGFIGMKEYTLRTGRQVILLTAPVDPRDLFRGDYIVLNYEINQINTKNIIVDDSYAGYTSYGAKGKTSGNEKIKEGDEIYVVLVKNPAFGKKEYYKAGKIYKDIKPKKNDLYIKGKVESVDLNGRARVKYGIEQYYVPEGKGKDLERARSGRLAVRVAVDNFGKAVIREVTIIEKEDVSELESDFMSDDEDFEMTVEDDEDFEPEIEVDENIPDAKRRNLAQIKSNMNSAVPPGVICRDGNSEVLSGNGGDNICSGENVGKWPIISFCGSSPTDTRWTVFNGKADEFNFTLNCAGEPACNGPQNAICDMDGCEFVGTCR
jgi:uncharacterized membrane-anchored protein